MSRRIRGSDRDLMVRGLMYHKWSLKVLLLAADFAKLADQAYNTLFSEKERIMIDQLPERWLPGTTHLQFQLGQKNYCSLYFNGWDSLFADLGQCVPRADRPDDIHRPVPDFAHQTCAARYESDHPLSIAYAELLLKQQEMHAQIKETRARAQGTLSTYTSFVRLFEDWPEIKPFSPLSKEETVVQLPALPKQELNAMFELPKDEAA